jgi:hypothetical protein
LNVVGHRPASFISQYGARGSYRATDRPVGGENNAPGSIGRAKSTIERVGKIVDVVLIAVVDGLVEGFDVALELRNGVVDLD